MEVAFCWEYKGCTRSCTVKESETLFCWRAVRDSAFDSTAVCGRCDYKSRWMRREFSASSRPTGRRHSRARRDDRTRLTHASDRPAPKRIAAEGSGTTVPVHARA